MTVRYSDLDVSFSPHPITRDLMLVTEEVAINRHIEILANLYWNEILFRPDIDAGPVAYLFELNTDHNRASIARAMREGLAQREPRIEIIETKVDFVNGDMRVGVDYRFKKTGRIVNYETILRRVR